MLHKKYSLVFPHCSRILKIYLEDGYLQNWLLNCTLICYDAIFFTWNVLTLSTPMKFAYDAE
jgi:hypothetical protein